MNIRPETIKLLEENIGSTFFDISLSNVLLDLSPQARETKAKINKTTSNEKASCTAKEAIDKMKRQATKWETIFEKQISDKGLISKIYK